LAKCFAVRFAACSNNAGVRIQETRRSTGQFRPLTMGDLRIWNASLRFCPRLDLDSGSFFSIILGEVIIFGQGMGKNNPPAQEHHHHSPQVAHPAFAGRTPDDDREERDDN